MNDSWKSARIAARREWAEGLVTFQLDLVLDTFEPGQFVNVALSAQTVDEKRSYSVASAKGAPLELFITKVPDGAVSPWIFDKHVGDEVLVNTKPAGLFTLAWVPDAQDLWLVSSGTGLGPFISMLRSEEIWRRFQRIIVVNGVRVGAHLAYAEELTAMSTAHGERLRYVPLVTREAVSGALHSRIPAAIASGDLEASAGIPLDPERTHVMLCGNPDMIKATIAALGDKGLRKHKRKEPGHISMEKYW